MTKIDHAKIIENYKAAFKAANGFSFDGDVRYGNGRFYFYKAETPHKIDEIVRSGALLDRTAVLNQRVRNKELDKV